MTPPDDRETRPESSQPSDTGDVWLPPRLRDKLTSSNVPDDDDFVFKKSSPVGLIVTLVVAVAAIVGVGWLIHSHQVKTRAAAAKAAAEERAAVVADSLAQVHQADSLAAVARADSLAFAALPKWQRNKILAEKARLAAAAAGSSASATASATTSAAVSAGSGAAAPPAAAATEGSAPPSVPAAPAEKGPYAIDAGQFLDEAQANQVADDLKTKIKLPVQVATIGAGDEATFHVLVGKFSSRSAAEAQGGALLAKNLVNQAPVIPIPSAK